MRVEMTSWIFRWKSAQKSRGEEALLLFPPLSSEQSVIGTLNSNLSQDFFN